MEYAKVKDFMGRELEVGDEVVYVDGRGQGAFLSIAVVDGFTPKMVKILKMRVNQTCFWFPLPWDDPLYNYEDRIEVGPYTSFMPTTVTPIKIIKVSHTGEHYGT